MLQRVGEKPSSLRVADWHTYFVGCEEWGFSVWAHNALCAADVWTALGKSGEIPAAARQAIDDVVAAVNRNASRTEIDDLLKKVQNGPTSTSKALPIADDLLMLNRPVAPVAPAAPPDPVIGVRPTVPDHVIREIARHVVEDEHPQATVPRYPGQTQAQIADRIRAVIHNARGADVHVARDGSIIYYDGGDTLIVRPEGQGTMIHDASRGTFRRWVRDNP